jgi:hypothetical protein
MPKSVLIILFAFALGLAACHGSTSPAPTTGPAVSPSPNPSISAATISVTFEGSPAPNVPVSISTPIGSPRPGTPFETKRTAPLSATSPGTVVFKKLSYKNTYCWVAQYSPTVTFSQCAGPITWQYSTITLGN